MEPKGRFLIHPLSSLSIECLPDKLPHEIAVDLASLKELEQVIQVKDLDLGPDITIHNDPEELIAKVSEKAVAEAVEEVVAVEEEVEGEEVAEVPPE